MLNLKEDILQFIWQHKLLKPLPLITTSGKEISILQPGELNTDSGPDFFNAMIKINGLRLAGNIEVHVKTDDWLKHNHQRDAAYDNLILHVVYEDNKILQQNTLNNVEVLEIKNLVPEELLNNYSTLIESKKSLACESQLPEVNDLKFTWWLQRMLIERLESKVKRIEEVFADAGGNYSQTFYTILLRSFGFKVNAVPFELLAKHLPLNVLLKHSGNLMQLEALLLGTAGFLDEQFSDNHVLSLQNEFEYLKTKYKIISLKKELFKFSRLRPANFPTLRLAQVAAVLHHQPQLFHSPHIFDAFEKIATALKKEASSYWKHHYLPDGNYTEKDLSLGTDSVNGIIINTFAPFFFFYFLKTGIANFEHVPLSLLEKCAFEKNLKTKFFLPKKHILKTAAESQGIINLYDNYCVKRKCLNCGIAGAILKSR
ncbi:MAG: hypothetical protein JWO32_128 [Bacteroidetes bacterium]|nr:hypothetical protein [Bacteroidota bacterium]